MIACDGLKRCCRCQMQLPLSEFYKDVSRNDGLTIECKSCKRERRLENLDHERAQDRLWYATHKEDKAERNRKYWIENKERVLAYQRGKKIDRWRRYPEKNKARHAVRDAIASGRLVKGACAVCGETEKVNGHHEDYSKPLDVVWLCTAHHAQLHRDRFLATLPPSAGESNGAGGVE